jgi:hypothetical protein
MGPAPLHSNDLYKGQNNYHENLPALMSDGREQSSWHSAALVNDNIKQSANIKSNWEYRQYLTNNAKSLMGINGINAVMQNPIETPNSNVSNSTPYNFKGINDMTQVQSNTFSSDLKMAYLTREQLEAKRAAPSIN